MYISDKRRNVLGVQFDDGSGRKSTMSMMTATLMMMMMMLTTLIMYANMYIPFRRFYIQMIFSWRLFYSANTYAPSNFQHIHFSSHLVQNTETFFVPGVGDMCMCADGGGGKMYNIE